jgi:hypothetical protein
MDAAEPDVLVHRTFLKPHWAQIAPTNPRKVSCANAIDRY